MRGIQTTHIFSHNIYRDSDKLYDPLRGTLQKRSASKQKGRELRPQQRSGLPAKQLRKSVISQEVRRMDSEEAKILKKNIYIPAARKLIPTQDLKNVENKQFKIVDINVHKRKPLTEEEFQRQHRSQSPVLKKIVYKVESNPLQKGSQKILMPSNSGTDVNFREDGIKISVNKPTESSEKLLQASPPKLKAATIFDSVATKIEKKPQRKPNILAETPTDEGYVRRSHSKYSRKKSEYKYNLFSIIDKATNSKCQTCWAENQLIATKPEKQRWV